MNWKIFPIIENEEDLSLSKQLSRNFCSWLPTVGSRSHRRCFGYYFSFKISTWKAFVWFIWCLFNVFSLSAWYPICLAWWYVDDRRLWFTLNSFSTKIAVDNSLTKTFGAYSFFYTFLLLLWFVTFCFLDNVKKVADWMRLTCSASTK